MINRKDLSLLVLIIVVGAVVAFLNPRFLSPINLSNTANLVGLFGIFALALLWPRAGPRAGVVGLIAGTVCVFAVHWTLKIEFLWYNVVGCLGVLVFGVVTSLFERPAVPAAGPVAVR